MLISRLDVIMNASIHLNGNLDGAITGIGKRTDHMDPHRKYTSFFKIVISCEFFSASPRSACHMNVASYISISKA
jgi:hypothetical protein